MATLPNTAWLLTLVLPLAVHADLRVFACEPEWAALASEIGQQHVEAASATTALQDPHYIQARPSLIAQVRRADLVICSGAQLEIGWLPKLQEKANNRNVMAGTRGYFEASSFVERLDASADVDRAKGDIHPSGNPHVHMDPRNVALIATALAERMADLDPDNAEPYQARHREFLQRWGEAIERWETKAAPLKGKRVITHHKSWVYLERWLGMVEVANLEAVPGLPPTPAHLSQLVSNFASGGAHYIIRAPYQEDRPSLWLAQRTGIPAVELPMSIGGSPAATDLFSLFDDLIDRLLGATR